MFNPNKKNNFINSLNNRSNPFYQTSLGIGANAQQTSGPSSFGQNKNLFGIFNRNNYQYTNVIKDVIIEEPPEQNNLQSNNTFFTQQPFLPSPQTSHGFFNNLATAKKGTVYKFVSKIATDLKTVNGINTTYPTRMQSLTFMKEYENKSFEELRWEDYLENRRQGTMDLNFQNSNENRTNEGLFVVDEPMSLGCTDLGKNVQQNNSFQLQPNPNIFKVNPVHFNNPLQTSPNKFINQKQPIWSAAQTQMPKINSFNSNFNNNLNNTNFNNNLINNNFNSNKLFTVPQNKLPFLNRNITKTQTVFKPATPNIFRNVPTTPVNNNIFQINNLPFSPQKAVVPKFSPNFTTPIPQIQNFPKQIQNFPAQVQNFPTQIQNFPKQIQNFPAQVQNFPTQIQNFPTQFQNFPTQFQNFPTQFQNFPTQFQNFPTQIQQQPLPENQPNNALVFPNIYYTKNLEIATNPVELEKILTTIEKKSVTLTETVGKIYKRNCLFDGLEEEEEEEEEEEGTKNQLISRHPKKLIASRIEKNFSNLIEQKQQINFILKVENEMAVENARVAEKEKLKMKKEHPNIKILQAQVEIPSHHPTGITLTRPEYYTIPTLDELINYVNSDGSCIVQGFTIGRKGFGNVYFPDSIDVSNLNIDKSVKFKFRKIKIHDSKNSKKSLNRRAQVTLDQVWPVDIKTKTIIKDPKHLMRIQYTDKLRRICEKQKTTFLDYRPETGSWVFKVRNFKDTS